MAAKTAYLASTPRYEILDGLRGVASLIVVLFQETPRKAAPDGGDGDGHRAVLLLSLPGGRIPGFIVQSSSIICSGSQMEFIMSIASTTP